MTFIYLGDFQKRIYQRSLSELACTELAEVSKAVVAVAFPSSTGSGHRDKLRQHFGKLSASGYKFFWKSP